MIKQHPSHARHNSAFGRFSLSGAVLLVLLALLSACRSLSPAAVSTPPAPAAGLVRPIDAVTLRPGLVVSIRVLVAGKKEIEELAKPVSDIGTINLPLLGSLTVQDMTLETLSASLTDRYRKYFVAPHVLVDFDHSPASAGTSPWGYATILGRVKAPGRIGIPPTHDLTISGVIQRAGGFSTSAKTSAILVTRRGTDGLPVSREINFNDVGAEGRLEDDIPIEADDVIFVPETKF